MERLDLGPKQPIVVVLTHDHSLLELLRTVLTDLAHVEVYADEIRDHVASTVARFRPAAAIVDVRIGHEVRAWELVVALKEHDRTRTVPVLVCTAAGWVLEKQSPFLTRYAVKTWSEPFDVTELLRTLDEMLTTGDSKLRADEASGSICAD
jgi:DNA-binding response OmpR family regulator